MTELKATKEVLRADAEKYSSTAERLQLTETRLGEALEQHDIMKTEHEEMFVQFDLLKHELDESNGYMNSNQGNGRVRRQIRANVEVGPRSTPRSP